MNEKLTIETASPSDKDAVLSLLTRTNLPHDGVSDHLSSFLVARDDLSGVIGCAGLEDHGELGLLRSVAVTHNRQTSEIGTRLVEAVIDEAKRNGLQLIILLTTSAREFFAQRFNFVETARENYHESLRNSPEWTLPRCSSAVVMKLKL